MAPPYFGLLTKPGVDIGEGAVAESVRVEVRVMASVVIVREGVIVGGIEIREGVGVGLQVGLNVGLETGVDKDVGARGDVGVNADRIAGLGLIVGVGTAVGVKVGMRVAVGLATMSGTAVGEAGGEDTRRLKSGGTEDPKRQNSRAQVKSPIINAPTIALPTVFGERDRRFGCFSRAKAS